MFDYQRRTSPENSKILQIHQEQVYFSIAASVPVFLHRRLGEHVAPIDNPGRKLPSDRVSFRFPPSDCPPFWSPSLFASVVLQTRESWIFHDISAGIYHLTTVMWFFTGFFFLVIWWGYLGRCQQQDDLLRWVCLKIVYPYTQWLMIIIRILNGYFIGGIPHFQTYPDVSKHGGFPDAKESPSL